MQQELVSLKKLATRDGQWSTQKTILGWALDTTTLTLALPSHRAEYIHKLLKSVPHSCTCIALCHWHQLLGNLQSMVLVLPGSQGLFSSLQEAFCHCEKPGTVFDYAQPPIVFWMIPLAGK